MKTPKEIQANLKTKKMKILKNIWEKLFYTRFDIEVYDWDVDEARQIFDIDHVFLRHCPSVGNELNFYFKEHDQWVYAEILQVEYTLNAFESLRANRYSVRVKIFM
jgi:hypothetical protein